MQAKLRDRCSRPRSLQKKPECVVLIRQVSFEDGRESTQAFENVMIVVVNRFPRSL
jgi:hypothetical protein